MKKMKNTTWVILMWFGAASSAFSAEPLTIRGDGAVKLTKAFAKNFVDNVRGALTVKSLVCRVKRKGVSALPYSQCEYVAVGATRALNWNTNDMGTKSAFETMSVLSLSSVPSVKLDASDIRNKYIQKVQAKKVVCEANGNSCVVTL